MLLPNASRAVVDVRKLADYCLNPLHPIGRHKAAVFQSALGWTMQDAAALRQTLLTKALTSDAEPGPVDAFGQRFTIDFPIATALGEAMIRSAWIIRQNEDFPRLTTCFVL